MSSLSLEQELLLVDSVIEPQEAMWDHYASMIERPEDIALLSEQGMNPLISGLIGLGHRYWSHNLTIHPESEHKEFEHVIRAASMQQLLDQGVELVPTELSADEQVALEAIGEERYLEVFNTGPTKETIDTITASEHSLLIPRKGILAAASLRGVADWSDEYAQVSPTPQEFLDQPYYNSGGRYVKHGAQQKIDSAEAAIRSLTPALEISRKGLWLTAHYRYPQHVRDIADASMHDYSNRLSELARTA